MLSIDSFTKIYYYMLNVTSHSLTPFSFFHRKVQLIVTRRHLGFLILSLLFMLNNFLRLLGWLSLSLTFFTKSNLVTSTIKTLVGRSLPLVQTGRIPIIHMFYDELSCKNRPFHSELIDLNRSGKFSIQKIS